MITSFKTKLLFISLLAMALAGCSSLPTELNADSKIVISDYKMWVDLEGEGEHSQTQDVRLGGVIAKVTNLEDKTRIEIANLPIGKDGKPDLNAEPNGRFVGYIDGYVEPISFAKGRLISVVGQSQGLEGGTVGEFPYTFPVMNVYGHRLWQIKERVLVTDTTSGYYSCRSLYCRNFDARPKQGRVIQEVK